VDIYLLKRFREAVSCLPEHIAGAAYALCDENLAAAEEFRLRVGRAPGIVADGREKPLMKEAVKARDIAFVLEKVTRASLHSAAESMKAGFVTFSGGHRVGICGTAVLKDEHVEGFRNISSLNIRIAKEMKGIAERLMPQLKINGEFCSTLIAAPPGRGKTTLLRDMVRTLSNEGVCCCVADERGEIAAMANGAAQLDVGSCTDVITAAPRDKAALMLLRSMNPRILALDEITDPKDAEAVYKTAYCGVKLIATAHAGSLDELRRKEIYKDLLKAGLFRRIVFVGGNGGKREYKVESGVM